MQTKNLTGKIFSVLMVFGAVCMYFISDQTLEWIYPFYCKYIIQNLVRWGRIAAMVIVFPSAAIVFIRSRMKSSSFHAGVIMPFLCVYAGYLVSCLVNRGEADFPHLWDSFSATAVQVLIFVLVFSDEGVFLKKHCDDEMFVKQKALRINLFIHLIALGYLVLSLCNIVFYFFPQLYWYMEEPNWYDFFLGSKNRVGWPLMMGAFFAYSDVKLRHWKIMRVLCYILLAVNTAITGCVTLYIGLAAVTVYSLLPFVRRIFEKWNFYVFTAILLAMFAICMWGIDPLLHTTPVKAVLTAVGKDPSLSERTVIWSTGKDLAFEKPVFGHGLQAAPDFVPHSNRYGTTYHHAHNEYLQIWYEGGLLTLAAAFGMLFYTGKRLKRAQNVKCAGSVKAFLFFTLVMLLAELIPYYCWYIATVLCNSGVLLAERT